MADATFENYIAEAMAEVDKSPDVTPEARAATLFALQKVGKRLGGPDLGTVMGNTVTGARATREVREDGVHVWECRLGATEKWNDEQTVLQPPDEWIQIWPPITKESE